jgi:hypothetical protein
MKGERAGPLRVPDPLPDGDVSAYHQTQCR